MKKLKKWFQRCVLDSLIEKPPPLACILLCVFGSVFSIGFWCAHWIDEVNLSKYNKLYDVFSDNIGGYAGLNSMRDLLPIDVVYTWVNGSDSLVTENLKKYANFEISSCNNVDCFPSSYYTLELDVSDDDDNDLVLKNANFIQIYKVINGNSSKSFALFLKKEEEEAKQFITQLKALKSNSSVEQTFWTTDSKMDWSIAWQRGLIARLDSEMEIHVEISNISPSNYNDFSKKCRVSKHFGLVLVECSDELIVKKILNDYDSFQLQFKRKYPKLWEARLILRSDVSAKELDSSRFEDNEELRYSLRSLEKFAPWVRRVFLVTNGQIPNWINLDHPRLSIITHDQIFSDLSHLPTFSSPAIEANIHRIPGLAKYFLYLNDDIILGDTVHPDDFISPTSGYKVYLSWFIPDCASGCPGTWLGDGYCDQTCNTSACFWDGGDCTKPKDQQMSRDNIYDMEDEDEQFAHDSEYCAPACSFSWLADTYCDSACTTRSCGFDAGDCGAKVIRENLNELVLSSDLPGDERLTVPKGEPAAWMNIKPFMNRDQNNTLKGSYSHSKGVAVVTFNIPLGILIFVFKPNTTGVIEVDFNITNKMGDKIRKVHFHVIYNTMPFKKLPFVEDSSNFNKTLEVVNYSFDVVAPKILNRSVPVGKKYPEIDSHLDKESKVKELYNRYARGELTDKGIKILKQFISREKSSLKEEKQNIDGENYLGKRYHTDIGNKTLIGKTNLLTNNESNYEKSNQKVNKEILLEKKKKSFDDNLVKKDLDAADKKKHVEMKLDFGDKTSELNKSDKQRVDDKNVPMKNNQRYDSENNLKNKLDLLDNRNQARNTFENVNNEIQLIKSPRGVVPVENENQVERNQDFIGNQNKSKMNQEFIARESHMDKKHDGKNKQGVGIDYRNSFIKKKIRIEDNGKNRYPLDVVNEENNLKNNLIMDGKDHELNDKRKNDTMDKLKIHDNIGDINNKFILNNNRLYKNTSNLMNRKLLSIEENTQFPIAYIGTSNDFSGTFPWERWSNSFKMKNEKPNFTTGRKLLDKFKDSLIYVNQLFNMEYGFQARKVPAHMPHFINKEILEEVHNKFSHEYEVTSSHKIREGNDMQFAFAYFYYLLSEKRKKTFEEIFDDYDTDLSGTWSDREIRSLLTRLYDLPLQYKYFVDIHNDIKNCSEMVKPKPVATPPYERYADSDVPTVSKELVVKCVDSSLWKKLEKLKNVPRFPHSVLSDSVVHFKMITSNVSRVVHHLDDIRKNIRKFICLNNNMDSKSKENDLVRALMQDTYESLFPVVSSFELPMNYRNRFSYTWELKEWKRWKYLLRSLIYAFLSCLIILTLTAFFSSEIESFKKRWLKRGRRRREDRLITRI